MKSVEALYDDIGMWQRSHAAVVAERDAALEKVRRLRIQLALTNFVVLCFVAALVAALRGLAAGGVS